MVEPLVKKAYEVEKEAVSSYFDGLAKIRGQGLRYEDVEKVIKRIAIDTIVHKHLMKAIMDAQEEIRKLGELETREEDIPEERKALIKRFAEIHLEIEKNMIETYEKMAEKMTHPLFKGLAKALMENEREHHKMLKELIDRYSL
ncbi:hypothetical protein PNA2_1574 [Pyrococcus sp. NA2]|nr:hypothetical protein PNA2_1574 [Pyrococcus sp. NA2]